MQQKEKQVHNGGSKPISVEAHSNDFVLGSCLRGPKQEQEWLSKATCVLRQLMD